MRPSGTQAAFFAPPPLPAAIIADLRKAAAASLVALTIALPPIRTYAISPDLPSKQGTTATATATATRKPSSAPRRQTRTSKYARARPHSLAGSALACQPVVIFDQDFASSTPSMWSALRETPKNDARTTSPVDSAEQRVLDPATKMSSMLQPAAASIPQITHVGAAGAATTPASTTVSAPTTPSSARAANIIDGASRTTGSAQLSPTLQGGDSARDTSGDRNSLSSARRNVETGKEERKARLELPASPSTSAEVRLMSRLFVALVVGGVIGMERRAANSLAGVRTFSLVSLGAAIFMTTTLLAFPRSDPTRVAAAISSSVGFLGAGAMQKNAKHSRGLTTASSVWLAAALGIAAATGMYMLSFTGALLTVMIARYARFDSRLQLIRGDPLADSMDIEPVVPVKEADSKGEAETRHEAGTKGDEEG